MTGTSEIFKFKTETHLHTAETSPCSAVDGATFIKLYAEAGYSTVFVSDHYRRKLFRECGPDGMRSAADSYMSGYRAAREAGKKLGVTVLPSCEICINKNDYLLYGVDEQFFAENNLSDITPAELYDMCSYYGITVIAAHPFRGERTPVVDCIHGIELVNAAANHYYINNNHKAAELAKSRPDLLTTSGSDAHHIDDVGRGGILTEKRIETAADYIEVLKSGRYKIIDNPPEQKPED